ncbi:MAG: hypothetical protein LUF80_04250 [Oscillospiraceae bacterium]|nr:hypothetical protein [Oscillospiraceae bacterium]MCD8330948.1 hypothetical protein [Oscillospiraceae bacterium]
MSMHKVEYKIQLTGSIIFDTVMTSTARTLCADFPGLNCEYTEDAILVQGELDDEMYEKYQVAMFGTGHSALNK